MVKTTRYLFNNLSIHIFIFCYYLCTAPNVYCKATAIKLDDGTVLLKKPHTHGSNVNR